MNERFEREYRDGLDSLRFSGDAKVRMVERMLEQEEPAAVKGRRFRPWRAAAIAACLCLALVGTAFAAQYFGVRMIDGTAEGVDVCLEGGIAYYPVDSLSDELQALENEHTYKVFDSWQEMEEFIGVELMNNPVLDATPGYYRQIIEKAYGIDIRGRFVVTTSVGLDHVEASGYYQMGTVDIAVNSYVYTERKTERVENWDERFLSIAFPEGTETGWETYTAANGLEVQIMTVERPYGYSSCVTAFSINGVPFVVEAGSDYGLEKAQKALYRVLDGFQQ